MVAPVFKESATYFMEGATKVKYGLTPDNFSQTVAMAKQTPPGRRQPEMPRSV
jgi:hypothetical protein